MAKRGRWLAGSGGSDVRGQVPGKRKTIVSFPAPDPYSPSHYLTITVMSFEPQGVVKVTV
jgi:hypothetical protein